MADFSTESDRKRVRVDGVSSNVLLTSAGSPQGGVLSPLLFILYTSEHQSQNEGGRIVKFVDDSVIVSLVNEHDTDHSPVGTDFFIFLFFLTGVSALNIKVSETKEMIIDFSGRSLRRVLLFVSKARLLQYKYLGTITDSNLMFDA